MLTFSHAEVLSVFGLISGDRDQEGYAIRFDAIEIEGRVWIVPAWFESPDGTHRVPERIIGLPQGALAPGKGDDPVLRDPIPKSVLDGIASPQSGYSVIERPNIRVQIVVH